MTRPIERLIMNKTVYRLRSAFMVGMLAFAIGCSRNDPPAPGGARQIRTAADLKGVRVAQFANDFHKQELEALQPEMSVEQYSEYSFAFESLRKRKLDAISLGKSYADIWIAKFPGEFRIAFELSKDFSSFLYPKKSVWGERIDAEIRKMNAAGETAAIIKKWQTAAEKGETPELPDLPKPPEGAPVIRTASAAQAEPWCFVAGDRLVGIDIEILSLIAHRLGARLEPKIYNWGGMIDAVNAGRCDVANGHIYTNGLKFPTVDISEEYADEMLCVLVRDESGARESSGLISFVRSLKASFIRTFLTEERWRMLLKGLGITLLITFLASLLGTLFAFPVWRARTSENRLVSAVARAYISILQGTPVLVLLMILFYIVFGSVDLDGLWVAVIGFAMNSSAYIAEMLRSGVDSVPIGQMEAALALGYHHRRAFFRFVLPQAVKTILPVYRGELVGLLKSTSIAGYIAINDLTKASDLIRSRTYEAFFPILTTAFVYFVLSWLMAAGIGKIGGRAGK